MVHLPSNQGNPETNSTNSVNPHALGGGFGNSTLAFQNPSETVNIQVHVTDGTDPIGQVEVAIDDITSTTGNAGGCTLRNVPVGTVTITANKEGYEEYIEELTITSETETLNITLTEE